MRDLFILSWEVFKQPFKILFDLFIRDEPMVSEKGMRILNDKEEKEKLFKAISARVRENFTRKPDLTITFQCERGFNPASTGHIKTKQAVLAHTDYYPVERSCDTDELRGSRSG